MKNQIKRFRWIALAEGLSFMVLLLIAMPLKYFAGWPLAVTYVGWTHGVLFMAYLGMVFLSMEAMKWNFISVVLALAASVVPLGPFFLDKSITKRLNELEREKGKME